MESSINLRNTQNLDQIINDHNNSAEEAHNKRFKKFFIDAKELEIPEEYPNGNQFLINGIHSMKIQTKLNLDRKRKFHSNK